MGDPSQCMRPLSRRAALPRHRNGFIDTCIGTFESHGDIRTAAGGLHGRRMLMRDINVELSRELGFGWEQ